MANSENGHGSQQYVDTHHGHSSSATKRHIKESRVTLMVIIISSNSLFGNVPNSISSLLFTLEIMSSIDYNKYLIFGNFLLFLSHGIHFFIYLFFNKSFKNKFLNMIKCSKIKK